MNHIEKIYLKWKEINFSGDSNNRLGKLFFVFNLII